MSSRQLAFFGAFFFLLKVTNLQEIPRNNLSLYFWPFLLYFHEFQTEFMIDSNVLLSYFA